MYIITNLLLNKLTHMKRSVLLGAFVAIFSLQCISQETVSAKVSRTGNEVSIQTDKNYVLLYEEATKGSITFKDKTFARALLNINLLTNEILFVNDKKELIPIDNQNQVLFASIGKDIFFNTSKGLVQVIANVNEIKLGILRQFKTESKETTGAYGIPSTTSSVTQVSSIMSNQSSMPTFTQLSVNQKVDLGYSEVFYLIKNDKFYSISNSKPFSKVFNMDKKELDSFAAKENIKFNEREDVLKIFNHCSSFDKTNKP